MEKSSSDHINAVATANPHLRTAPRQSRLSGGQLLLARASRRILTWEEIHERHCKSHLRSRISAAFVHRSEGLASEPPLFLSGACSDALYLIADKKTRGAQGHTMDLGPCHASEALDVISKTRELG